MRLMELEVGVARHYTVALAGGYLDNLPWLSNKWNDTSLHHHVYGRQYIFPSMCDIHWLEA